MTEQEWLQATDPQPLLEFLRGKPSGRKLRLFAVASCYRAAHLLFPDRRAEAVLELIERYADGSTSREEVTAFQFRMLSLPEGRESQTLIESVPPWWRMMGLMMQGGVPNIALLTHRIVQEVRESANDRHAALHASPGDEIRASRVAWAAAEMARSREHAFQCDLLRCIFGNAFRPVALDPSWLTWHDGLLVSMAQRIYESRDFKDMPVLADALEEAGCTNPDILGHCRQQGAVHVRGCWVIDCLLAKG
jgi:hypothetical protein